MELIELGKTPISQDSPSGVDVRYEPEYEELQNEVEKLTSLTSTEGINWDRVVQLGTAILAEKSKHLLVASYLCVALVQSRGVEGLETGFVIYRELLKTFWETLFPSKKRMRGRQNAVEWWKEKILSAIKSLPPNSALTEEKIDSLNENIEVIDSFLSKHLDDAPSLHQLQDSLTGLRLQVESEEVKQEDATARPEPITTTAPPTETTGQPEADTGALTEQDTQRMLNSGLEDLRQVATFYMRKDSSNAMSYRLTRVATWMPVEILPPAEDGKTRIPPPMTEIKNVVENLYEQENFKDLLESAESRISQFVFWLDLSHYTAVALEQLGYMDAHDAVIRETSVYVRRLPGIEKLAFSDGTPFANEETREWLKEIAIDKSTGAGDYSMISQGIPENSLDSQVAEIYKQAVVLVKGKKVAEGVELIQEPLGSAASQKSRFLWRIALVRLLLTIKEARLALPHLLGILDDIEKYNLDNWDPDLALKALAEVHRGLKAQKDEDLQKRAVDAMDHIARLNPVAALRLMEWEN